MTIVYDKTFPAGTRFPTQEQALRSLAADILSVVAEDVERGCAKSIGYLESPAFEWFCDFLDLDAQAAREALQQKAGTDSKQVWMPYKTKRRGSIDDFYLELHRVYMDENLSITETALRFGMKPRTVITRFYRMGLPTRQTARGMA